jgi:hypothetical protein
MKPRLLRNQLKLPATHHGGTILVPQRPPRPRRKVAMLSDPVGVYELELIAIERHAKRAADPPARLCA